MIKDLLLMDWAFRLAVISGFDLYFFGVEKELHNKWGKLVLL